MHQHKRGCVLSVHFHVVLVISCFLLNFVNSTSNEEGWIWIDGEASINSMGSYGVLQSADPNNFPGGRSRGVTWSNDEGLFLFGGYGYDSQGELGRSNS